MKWIIWSRFPFAIFKIHYLSFGMRHKATGRKRFPKVLRQVGNKPMSKRSRLHKRSHDRFSIKSEFTINSKLHAYILNLHITLAVLELTEAKKYCLYSKIISFTSTITKIKVQCADSFDIAAINATYLNNRLNISMTFAND